MVPNRIAIRPRAAAGFRDRRGSVLILILVVVAMLTLGAYSFSEIMLSESEASSMYGRQAETRAFADSGVELAAAVLGYPENEQDGNTFHNPDRYQAILMRASDDARGRGYFSIVTGVESNAAGQSVRFGLRDESGKLSINHLIQFELGDTETRELLMYLPNMSEDVADAILDWVDDDDTPREFGAESDYYSSLSPPYEAGNGPFESLDELLKVAGVTPDLLFGEDTNRNGLLDPNENDGDASAPYDNSDGILQPGWAAYLTVHSREMNLRSDGSEKIHINNGVLADLYDALEEEFDETIATYIIALRMNGPLNASTSSTGGSTSGGSNVGSSTSGSSTTGETSPGGGSSSSSRGGSSSPSSPGGSSGGGSTSGSSAGSSSGNSGSGNTGSTGSGSGSSPSTANSGGTSTEGLLGAANAIGNAIGGSVSGAVTRNGMNLSKGATYDIRSIYELIGTETQADFGTGTMTTVTSPWSDDPGALQDFLPILTEALSTTDDTQLVGRINVNEARAETLMGLPGMTEEMAFTIAGASLMADSGEAVTDQLNLRSTTGWLVAQGIVDLPTMIDLDKFLTTKGHVYRVQVVGFFEDGGGHTRIEAVLDATKSPAKILSISDLTELGRGYPRSTLSGVQPGSPQR